MEDDVNDVRRRSSSLVELQENSNSNTKSQSITDSLLTNSSYTTITKQMSSNKKISKSTNNNNNKSNNKLKSNKIGKNHNNYLSSDANGGFSTTTSVAGIGCSDYSDDNQSSHKNRNKNIKNNQYTSYTNYQQQRKRKKKHKYNQQQQQQQQHPPPYYPYPPPQPYGYPYNYPQPYPYPYPHPAHYQQQHQQQQQQHPQSNKSNKKYNKKSNKNRNIDITRQQQQPQPQLPPYYFWPGHAPYYGGPMDANGNNNGNGNHNDNGGGNMYHPYPYPYNHPYPPPSNMRPNYSNNNNNKKGIDVVYDDDDRKVEDSLISSKHNDDISNAEPVHDDYNIENKLFDQSGYQHENTPKNLDISLMDTMNSAYNSPLNASFHKYNQMTNDNHHTDDIEFSKQNKINKSLSSSSPGCNCFKLCFLLDMEHLFEIIEIVILLQFIIFIGFWWAERRDSLLLYILASLSVIFGILSLIMRGSQSSVRMHEVYSTLNDFRIILFIIGLLVVITSDTLRYSNHSSETTKYLWFAHSSVWIIAGLLYCSIDFAPYMSSTVCCIYHIIILIATSMEFVKVIYQIHEYDNNNNNDDDVQILFDINNIKYTLYNFKIDALLLMIQVEISSILTLIIDNKREWYCFGLGNIYRNRLLRISHHQHRNRNVSLMNSAQFNHVNNSSGNRFNYLYGNNEDSLLFIWCINLSIITYLTFFLWNMNSEYKSIPLVICLLSSCMLFYRECDFHLIPILIKQKHCIFTLISLLQLWFVTIYIIFYVNNDITTIGSILCDILMYSLCIIIILLTDLFLTSISSYFILRGTITIIMFSVSIFSIYNITFENTEINYIHSKYYSSYPISTIARNAYYFIIIITFCSIVSWIKQPTHKYFIYIQIKRKRTILNQYLIRNHDLDIEKNNKLQKINNNNTRSLMKNNSYRNILRAEQQQHSQQQQYSQQQSSPNNTPIHYNYHDTRTRNNIKYIQNNNNNKHDNNNNDNNDNDNDEDDDDDDFYQ